MVAVKRSTLGIPYKLPNPKLFCFNSPGLARLKFIFAYAAEGANPVFGDVFKGRSGFDTRLGVTHFGVVNPVADNTFVLLHVVLKV